VFRYLPEPVKVCAEDQKPGCLAYPGLIAGAGLDFESEFRLLNVDNRVGLNKA